MPGLRAPRPRIVSCTLVLAACLTAACSRVTVVGAGRTLDVGVTEYRITPQDVHAPAGGLTIVVHNYGRMTHNLALTRGGVQQASTAPIGPGAAAKLTLRLTRGNYLMVSTILSDPALGAYGTLIIR